MARRFVWQSGYASAYSSVGHKSGKALEVVTHLLKVGMVLCDCLMWCAVFVMWEWRVSHLAVLSCGWGEKFFIVVFGDDHCGVGVFMAN